jgi:uncharacterized protein YdeI (YjbR/CyaY-like superfamily)
VEITETLKVSTRAEWRTWLEHHHDLKKEIWLVLEKNSSALSYLDSVEEALCFGWIDGIAKKFEVNRTAQRFTPRLKKSHWTELNKERARRLIDQKLMTPAGLAVLPELSVEAFQIPDDILTALQADQATWKHFSSFPAVYQRIRIGYIEEMRRNPTVFQTRLQHFLRKTALGKTFGTIK